MPQGPPLFTVHGAYRSLARLEAIPRDGEASESIQLKSTTVADRLYRAKLALDGHSYRLDRSRIDRRRPRHIAGRVHRACRKDPGDRKSPLLVLIWLGHRRLLLLVRPSARRTAVQTACSSLRSTNTRPKQKPVRRAPGSELFWLIGQNANQSSRHHYWPGFCRPLQDRSKQATRIRTGQPVKAREFPRL